MVSVGSLPLSISLLVLLILPGLLGLDLYLRVSQQKRTLSRTRILLYSTGVGVASLVLLYLSSPIYFDWLTKSAQKVSSTFGLVRATQFSNISIAEVTILYALHVVVAVLFGFIVGKQHKRENSDRRDPWHYAFDSGPRNGETIDVITNDGTVIQGDFNSPSWDASRRELYLEDPYEIEYGENDKTIDAKSDMGRSIWLHEDQISQVMFLEKDPDRRVQPDIDEQNEEAESVENLPEDIQEVLGVNVDQQTLEDIEEDEE